MRHHTTFVLGMTEGASDPEPDMVPFVTTIRTGHFRLFRVLVQVPEPDAVRTSQARTMHSVQSRNST
jgi:hypothetical protein